MKQEFREQWIYALILKKLSMGYNSLGKLYSATNMDKANLSKYLNTLENLHIIRHILPIHKRKGGIYVIIDDYFDFWFRFVYSNRGMLEVGNKKQVRGKVERDFNSYCGRRFEYLVENGINQDRLSYKGYGSERPVTTIDTQRGRAKNRRTEITVL